MDQIAEIALPLSENGAELVMSYGVRFLNRHQKGREDPQDLEAVFTAISTIEGTGIATQVQMAGDVLRPRGDLQE